MNRVTKRTWLMGLFLGILLGGMGLFFVEYLIQGPTWVTFPGAPSAPEPWPNMPAPWPAMTW